MTASAFPQTFLRSSPQAVRGEGCFLFTGEGQRYLDAAACGGAAIIGHGVEAVAQAIGEQAGRLASLESAHFRSSGFERLAERLLELAPSGMRRGGSVLFAASGSEALEASIKLARQYWIERGEPNRHRIISRRQSYHGGTLGALAISGSGRLRDPFAPMLAESRPIAPCFCYRCPLSLRYPECNADCADELDRLLARDNLSDVAAFVLEPVCGDFPGATAPPDGYLQKIASICRRREILLIADEQATAMGRTGKPFAVQHWGVVPDMIVGGSSITGGYVTAGAVVAEGRVVQTISRGSGSLLHDLGTGASPLAAAAGNAVLDFLERENLLSRVEGSGRELREALACLNRFPVRGEVRGLGLLLAVELVRDAQTREPFPPDARMAQRIQEEAWSQGILVRGLQGCADGVRGDHILIAPPFTITSVMIHMLASGLSRALADFEASRTDGIRGASVLA